MKNIRVVFDTNIWISFFISSKTDLLVDLIIDKNLLVHTSEELIKELEDVLSRKKFKKYLSLPIKEYIDFHKELCILYKTKPVSTECPDPKDNFLYDLAIQSKSKYIVTGDKVLLLQNHPKFNFISLIQFKSII